MGPFEAVSLINGKSVHLTSVGARNKIIRIRSGKGFLSVSLPLARSPSRSYCREQKTERNELKRLLMKRGPRVNIWTHPPPQSPVLFLSRLALSLDRWRCSLNLPPLFPAAFWETLFELALICHKQEERARGLGGGVDILRRASQLECKNQVISTANRALSCRRGGLVCNFLMNKLCL